MKFHLWIKDRFGFPRPSSFYHDKSIIIRLPIVERLCNQIVEPHNMNEASVMILETVSGWVQILLQWIIDQCGSSKSFCGLKCSFTHRVELVNLIMCAGLWRMTELACAQFELTLLLDIAICQIFALSGKYLNEFGWFAIFPWIMSAWRSCM